MRRLELAERRTVSYDGVMSNGMASGRVGHLAARVGIKLAAFATALRQVFDGYMHPAPGC